MNVLKNLLNYYDSLPVETTNRAIVKQILIHLVELDNVTIDELASKVSASRTTIWRIVKQLGYEDYHSFSHELSQAIRKYTLYNKVDMGAASSDPKDCLEKILQKLRLVQAAMSTISVDKAAEIVTLLHQANRVGFYNFDNRYVRELQMNLSFTGKETNILYLKPDMLQDAKTTDSRTVTFVHVLEFAEVMDIADVFGALQERSGKIILFSSEYSSRYNKYADICLQKEMGYGSLHLGTFWEDAIMALLNEIYRGSYIPG